MAITKEYRCAAHGEFESETGACPAGCPADFVAREIRTAPAHHNGGTAHTDRELRNLAQDYGLSDLKNDKDGSSVMSCLKRPGQPASDLPKWADISKTHAAPGFSKRGEAPQSMTVPGVFGNHLSGQNGLEGFKFGQPRPAFVGKPKDATPLQS